MYEDVDGLYSIAVPNDFSAQQLVTFDVLADNELDQLLDSTGIIFAQPDRENGLSVLLLLLDETITNEDEFRGFLDAFQTAAGGETLPQVNFDLVGGDSLHASGVAATVTVIYRSTSMPGKTLPPSSPPAWSARPTATIAMICVNPWIASRGIPSWLLQALAAAKRRRVETRQIAPSKAPTMGHKPPLMT